MLGFKSSVVGGSYVVLLHHTSLTGHARVPVGTETLVAADEVLACAFVLARLTGTVHGRWNTSTRQ